MPLMSDEKNKIAEHKQLVKARTLKGAIILVEFNIK